MSKFERVLQNAGIDYILAPSDILDLCDEDKEYLISIGFDLNEAVKNDYCISVSADDYEAGNIEGEHYREMDEILMEDDLKAIFPVYPHFLVYSCRGTWNGASGCGLFSSPLACIRNLGDCRTSVERYLHRKKTLECVNYSHDVPMGHSIYFIGLTEGQYQALKGTDFDTMYQFAEQYI